MYQPGIQALNFCTIQIQIFKISIFIGFDKNICFLKQFPECTLSFAGLKVDDDGLFIYIGIKKREANRFFFRTRHIKRAEAFWGLTFGRRHFDDRSADVGKQPAAEAALFVRQFQYMDIL